MSVVFPAASGPTTPVNFPAAIDAETASSAGRSSPGKVLETLRKEASGGFISLARRTVGRLGAARRLRPNPYAGGHALAQELVRFGYNHAHLVDEAAA